MKEKLIEQLLSANAAYARGLPIMTDSEYDQLWQQLYDIAPNEPCLYHTGYNPDLPYNKLQHKHPIYGTNKAFNTEDLKPFLQRFGDSTIVIEPKYDGCAAVFYAGKTEAEDKLILEGNGLIGADISRHLPYIYNKKAIRSQMCSVELVIPWANWDSSYGANPRNTVAGWLNSKDISEHNQVIKMVSHQTGKLKIYYNYNGDIEQLVSILLKAYSEWYSIYPIDGLMLKPKDEQRRLISGNNGQVFNWSLAWKPPIQTAKTVVTAIEWNVSRHGRVIPTVCYQPIELCGTVNQRVTANNAEWLREKEIRINSIIRIGKAGEIIPKIISVIPNTTYTDLPELPTKCPICGSILIKSSKDLICKGSSCIAQLIESLDYFYSDKGMEIKSLGAARIAELLYNEELRLLLNQKPWALLDPDVYQITDKIKSIFGDKLYAQYITSLFDIYKKKTPINFISALGLPKLATRTVTKLYNYIKFNSPVKSVSTEAMKNFSIGYTKFIQAEKELTHFKFAKITPPADIIYSITGKLSMPRKDFISLLSTKGWQFANQVSSKTTFLIIGEEPGRTKTASAKQYKTKIIDEDTVLSLIKTKGDNND